MATSDERLLALEGRVRELQAALEPQRVRNSLERTWNPRGTADEVRVQGPTGNVLPKVRRRIQFLGGVTDDPANNRYVVAGGDWDGDLVAPSDATYPAGTKIRWMDGSSVRMTINTDASGSTKAITMAIPGYPQPSSQFGARIRLESSTSAGLFHVRAVSSSGSAPMSESSGSASATSASHVARAVRQAGSEHATTEMTSSGSVSTCVTTCIRASVSSILEQTNTTLTITAGTIVRRVVDSAGLSNFMQLQATGATTPIQRIMRGPFSAAPGSLAAAGGTTTVSVSNAAPGGNCVVMGGIKGAAGMEYVQWSYTVSGTSVVVSFTNTDPTNALTATLEFYTACDS